MKQPNPDYTESPYEVGIVNCHGIFFLQGEKLFRLVSGKIAEEIIDPELKDKYTNGRT